MINHKIHKMTLMLNHKLLIIVWGSIMNCLYMLKYIVIILLEINRTNYNVNNYNYHEFTYLFIYILYDEFLLTNFVGNSDHNIKNIKTI